MWKRLRALTFFSVMFIAIPAHALEQLEFQNGSRYPKEVEIRSGETGASSCATNRHITTKTLEPGESITLPCAGRPGYCWRSKLEADRRFPDEWYGAACTSYGKTGKVSI